MVVQIQKNASQEEIKEALEKIKLNKKVVKGYPDLDKFFGVIREQEFVKIQKK